MDRLNLNVSEEYEEPVRLENCNTITDLPEYPEIYMIEDARKLKLAQHLKSLGVEHFKANKLELAFQNFSESLKLLVVLDGKDGHDISPAIAEVKAELTLILYNNLAGCHVLRKNWELAIDLSNSVLEQEPQNVKALYRRGWSRIETEDYELAETDLQKALKLDPNNKAVREKLLILASRVKALNTKYANAMKKMFS